VIPSCRVDVWGGVGSARAVDHAEGKGMGRERQVTNTEHGTRRHGRGDRGQEAQEGKMGPEGKMVQPGRRGNRDRRNSRDLEGAGEKGDEDEV
jgi:hypothetical protein